MKILTDTVEDNDRSVDRITNDSQHTSDKSISYGNSGNRIECKYNKHVVKKRKYRTACKTDIFETEPDVKQHENSRNKNGYYSISSHFVADSGGNTLCLDQGFIYTKLVNKRLIQRLTFVKIQGTSLDDNLVCSNNLGRLYILISCNLFHNRSNLRINGLNIHIFVKGDISGSTA